MKFFNWNLNVLAAHKFAKVPLIEVHTKSFDFDIVCLSSTFLDLSSY